VILVKVRLSDPSWKEKVTVKDSRIIKTTKRKVSISHWVLRNILMSTLRVGMNLSWPKRPKKDTNMRSEII